MKLTLPILIHTEASQQMEEMGLDYDMSELCTRTNAIFYSINCIYPYIDEQGESSETMTSVFCSDTSFIVDLPFEEVENLIKQQQYE